MSQNKITLIGLALFLWLNGICVFGQPNRGVGVRVKNQQIGKIQEVKLYEDSYALVIGESIYINGWDNLPDVAEDVKAARFALKRQGFGVQLVTESEKV